MPKKKQNVITIDDIAAATGFNKSTISVTLRNHPKAEKFSPETRARIREESRQTMRKLGIVA